MVGGKHKKKNNIMSTLRVYKSAILTKFIKTIDLSPHKMKTLHRIAYVYTYLMRQGDLSSTFKSELDAMIGDMKYKPWSDEDGTIYDFLEKLESLFVCLLNHCLTFKQMCVYLLEFFNLICQKLLISHLNIQK